MNKHNHDHLSLDWLGIYTAYAESGLNKQEFYSCHLSSLLPPNAKRPPAKEFYSTLRLLEQLAVNKQLRFSDKQDDEIVRVATFSPQALEPPFFSTFLLKTTL